MKLAVQMACISSSVLLLSTASGDGYNNNFGKIQGTQGWHFILHCSEIADSFAKKKIVIFASVFIERNERRMVSKIEGREILWYALAGLRESRPRPLKYRNFNCLFI